MPTLLTLLAAPVAGAPLSPFEVNFGLFFWTWAVFIALFFILKKFAWPSILRATEERERAIERQLGELDFEPQRLLLSFHGMPQRTLELGDPYHCHCHKTARLLGEKLPIPTDIAFQSRFGRAKWLEPATDVTLAAYPAKGVTRLAIAAPGFSADCIETLEEIAMQNRDFFLAAGGQELRYIPALNAAPAHAGSPSAPRTASARARPDCRCGLALVSVMKPMSTSP